MSSAKNVLALTASTLEKEYDMKLRSNASASNLFDSIIAATGIRETWWFGLNHVDDMGEEAWLDLNKKLKQQHLNKKQDLRVTFKAKFFPKDVSVEVVQSITLRLLFKQVQSDILEEILYCPADKAVLLASLAAQARLGDLDDELHQEGYLGNEPMLPPRVLEQHTLSMQEWEQKIRSFHAQHAGLASDEAMLEYLKVSQELEMYGITYFPVYNARGSEALVGIDALGINFYKVGDKFSPIASFPWAEIDALSYKKDRFKIKFLDKRSETHVVRGKYARTAAKMFDLATGNFAMHRRRLQPDPLHVQQMRAQRDEERSARERERARLRLETDRRRQLEQSRLDVEERSKQLEDEVKMRISELNEAKSRQEQLKDQLKVSMDERDGLERRQEELRERVETLEKEREQETQERSRLQQNILEKTEEIEQVRREVELRQSESEKLKQEVMEKRNQVDTNELQNSAVMEEPENKTNVTIVVEAEQNGEVEEDKDEEKEEIDQGNHDNIEKNYEEEREEIDQDNNNERSNEENLNKTISEDNEKPNGLIEELQAKLARQKSVEKEDIEEQNQSNGIIENETNLSKIENEIIANGLGNGDALNHEEDEINIDTHQPLPETKALLKDLRSTLTENVVEGATTAEDEQYERLSSLGRSKFRTLSEVRKGNTKRRIDIFESM